MRKSIKTNAILNMVKQIMQVLFPIITIPYVTRVLLTDNYGKINTGTSIINYIALIAGLGISAYAIREGSLVRDDKKKLSDFSSQVFTINLLSTVISYAILAILIFLVPHYAKYRLLFIIQSVSVLFTTLGADWINSIEEDYLYLTIRYIVLHIISVVLLFLFVKKPEDYYLYAGISLVTSVGANILNIFYIRRYVNIHITTKIDWKKHLPPILILFGNTIATTIYVSSDITMLEIYKGNNEVGIYTVATKIYAIIKQILNAVLMVSIPKLTTYYGSGNNDGFLKLGRKMLNALITLMSPLIVGIIIFRVEAISFAGGEKYLAGSDSLLILSLAVSFALFATFYSGCVLMPLREEKKILRGTTISAILNVSLNFLFIPLLGGKGAAITTLISEVFVCFYFYIIAKNRGYRFIEKKSIILSVIGGIGIAIISVIVKSIIADYALHVVIAVIVSAFIYLLIQVLGKNSIVLELINKVRKTKKHNENN